jgi:exosome complex RNA-binding protein Rrp4
MDEIKVTGTSYLDFRDGKLVEIRIKITEGFYYRPAVIDMVVGSVIDIIA